MRHIFYDTEFIERGGAYPINLISIGMVDNYGRELYAINGEINPRLIASHAWLRNNVLPHLPVRQCDNSTWDWDFDHPEASYIYTLSDIADMVKKFVLGVRETRELWTWYGAYDHVVICQQLFGTMMQLPPGFPMWSNDLRQEVERLDAESSLPPISGDQHKAIDDARWNWEVFLRLFPGGKWR
ncbi:MAG TPA: 3'-5' exoribonuclease [Candidatus Paceibacterota bacterium]